MITDPTPPADPTGPETEPNRQAPRFDQRGIALQTVIIIVVMLAIAGTVAAVLLSRAGDVTSELEATDITPGRVDNAAECAAATWSATTGNAITGNWDGARCTWTETAGADGDEAVTAARCRLAGGEHTASTTAAKNAKCVAPPPPP